MWVFAKCQTSFKSDHRFVYVGLRRVLRDIERKYHLSPFIYSRFYYRNTNDYAISYFCISNYFKLRLLYLYI